MALPAEKRKLTAAEYLALEEKAEFKSEFYGGEMFPLGGAPHAMAGGRPEHSLVAANLGGTLWARLGGGPCRVYNSDLRVHIALTGVYTYPDLAVVCGEPRFTGPQGGLVALVNPTVLVEVLSPTTADADRGEKFMQYQQIETLREYVLVAIDRPRVEHFARQGRSQWLFTVNDGLEAGVMLPALGNVEVPLGEIYRGVEFPPGTARPSAPSPGNGSGPA